MNLICDPLLNLLDHLTDRQLRFQISIGLLILSEIIKIAFKSIHRVKKIYVV